MYSSEAVKCHAMKCSAVKRSALKCSAVKSSAVRCSAEYRRTLGSVDHLHHVMERFARDFSIWMFRQEVGILLLYRV